MCVCIIFCYVSFIHYNYLGSSPSVTCNYLASLCLCLFSCGFCCYSNHTSHDQAIKIFKCCIEASLPWLLQLDILIDNSACITGTKKYMFVYTVVTVYMFARVPGMHQL